MALLHILLLFGPSELVLLDVILLDLYGVEQVGRLYDVRLEAGSLYRQDLVQFRLYLRSDYHVLRHIFELRIVELVQNFRRLIRFIRLSHSLL